MAEYYTQTYRYKTWAGGWVNVPHVARVSAEGQYAVFYAADNTVIKMVAFTGATEVEAVSDAGP